LVGFVREVVAMAAGDRFQVDLEALAGSAAHVNGQGENLATAHLSSDNRIAAAQSGWVGASAAALNTRVSIWLATSRRLLTRVAEHALDLTNDGIDFAALERENVETLRAVGGGVEGLLARRY
jgi:WXG100 family type VII secretion target